MNIELTKEEAIVLFAWLYKHSSKAEYFDDLAEQCLFWRIENQLEKELDEPHSLNYTETLAKARENVRNSY